MGCAIACGMVSGAGGEGSGGDRGGGTVVRGAGAGGGMVVRGAMGGGLDVRGAAGVAVAAGGGGGATGGGLVPGADGRCALLTTVGVGTLPSNIPDGNPDGVVSGTLASASTLALGAWPAPSAATGGEARNPANKFVAPRWLRVAKAKSSRAS